MTGKYDDVYMGFLDADNEAYISRSSAAPSSFVSLFLVHWLAIELAMVSNIMPKQQESSTSLLTRGHTTSKSFDKEQQKSIWQNFLSIRIVNEWNNLPTKIVEAPNLRIFERRLDQYWRQHGLKYNLARLPYRTALVFFILNLVFRLFVTTK